MAPKSSDGRAASAAGSNAAGQVHNAPSESTPILSTAQTGHSYQALDGQNGAVPSQKPTDATKTTPAAQPASVATDDDGVRQRWNPASRASNREGDSASVGVDASSPSSSESWWTKMTEKYGAVELDNKGSTARDHLALERTFLAWLRTSLAFAGIGIAITQLFRLNTSIGKGETADGSAVKFLSILESARLDPSDQPRLLSEWAAIMAQESRAASTLRAMGKPLGATFIGISILVLLAGWRRYAESQHYIIRGKFPASRGSIALVVLAALVLIISTFVIVVVAGPANSSSNS